MGRQSRDWSLELRAVHEEGDEPGGIACLRLETDAGAIRCRFHSAEIRDAAVIWVFGAGGGLGGPAGGLYPRLAEQLRPHGVASLRLDYRHPGHVQECVLDVLLGCTYLAGKGYGRIVLVGHSFGGAVVITAGAASGAVIGVAALSSQSYGAVGVGDLSPRPLLLIHGAEDEILPDACSRDLYRRAREPREIILYPGCRHGLDECRDSLDRDLLRWLSQVLAIDLHGA